MRTNHTNAQPLINIPSQTLLPIIKTNCCHCKPWSSMHHIGYAIVLNHTYICMCFSQRIPMYRSQNKNTWIWITITLNQSLNHMLNPSQITEPNIDHSTTVSSTFHQFNPISIVKHRLSWERHYWQTTINITELIKHH